MPQHKLAADWIEPFNRYKSDLARDRKRCFRFYTARGELTDYALQRGYVERRGDSESGMVLSKMGCRAFLVQGDGRWIRGHATQRFGTLADARRYFHAFDHRALSREIAARHGSVAREFNPD